MINAMSKTENVQFTPPIAISTIWDVQADFSYSVNRPPSQSNTLLAIRTINGCGVLELADNNRFILNTNSLIIVKLDELKSYRTKNDFWYFKWFEFYADQDILPELNTVYSFECTDYEIYSIQNCFHLLSSQSHSACLTASAIFLSITALWHNIITSHNNATYADILEKTIEHINSNINSHLSVCNLAKKANMSERTFRDVFKEYIGVSPKQYIEQKKLALAMELLNSTYMQIKEISFILGFSNPYYFSRAFKKHFGNPPTIYMKK